LLENRKNKEKEGNKTGRIEKRKDGEQEG